MQRRTLTIRSWCKVRALLLQHHFLGSRHFALAEHTADIGSSSAPIPVSVQLLPENLVRGCEVLGSLSTAAGLAPAALLKQ